MHLFSVGDRLKYYRKLLNISQKELADNKVSSNLISLIERGRVPLSTVTASILVDNINRISVVKGIHLNLSIKDLMISDEEYVKKICQDRLKGEKSINEIKRIYNELIALSDKFGEKKYKAIIEVSIANKLFQIGEYDEAIEHYGIYISIIEVFNKEPKKDELYMYGIALYNIRDYVNSKKILERLMDLTNNQDYDSKNFDSNYLLACIHYENREFDTSIEYLKTAMGSLNNMETVDERVMRLSTIIKNKNKGVLMNLYKDIKHGLDIGKKDNFIQNFDIYEDSLKNLDFKGLVNKDYFLMLLILLENYINSNEIEKAKAIISSARKNISNQ